jgi:hypothetical protein
MRYFLNAITDLPHPEEARSAVSKDAGRLCNPAQNVAPDWRQASTISEPVANQTPSWAAM